MHRSHINNLVIFLAAPSTAKTTWAPIIYPLILGHLFSHPVERHFAPVVAEALV